MLNRLLIREVRPDDAEAVVNILNPIIESGLYTVLDTPFSVEEERDFIRRFPSRGVFQIALRQTDQRIVGFQNVEPFAAYTRAFDHVGIIGTYVDLTCRRQGIATRLFQSTFEAARRKRYEKLFTYVRADNPAALTTYLKQGFQIVGEARRQARIAQNYIDEIIIEKFL